MENISFWEFFRLASFRVKLRLGFLGLSAILVLVMASTSIFFIAKTSLDFSRERQRQLASIPAPAAPAFAFAYELRDLSLALGSRDAGRTSYAQFSLVLDCPTEGARREM